MQDQIDTDGRSWQDEANCLGVDPDLFFPEHAARQLAKRRKCAGVAWCGSTAWNTHW